MYFRAGPTPTGSWVLGNIRKNLPQICLKSSHLLQHNKTRMCRSKFWRNLQVQSKKVPKFNTTWFLVVVNTQWVSQLRETCTHGVSILKDSLGSEILKIGLLQSWLTASAGTIFRKCLQAREIRRQIKQRNTLSKCSKDQNLKKTGQARSEAKHNA